MHEENEELKRALVMTRAELEHAKKNLVAYMQSVGELEERVRGGGGKGAIVDKLRLEVMRLNEENQGLAQAKEKMESMYV